MSRELETVNLRHAYNSLKFCANGDTDVPELIGRYKKAAQAVGELLEEIMVECQNFVCGSCRMLRGDSQECYEESRRCTKKRDCEEYEPRM